ncbi:MAG: ABC transporter ATP-binding protein/permease [Spirochaetaceae bacterium]|jgi:ATP-binding cassette subfamily B protein|nr:ABC transporter ATP-binding protein/permease [Spirochaetaceae bacterium]
MENTKNPKSAANKNSLLAEFKTLTPYFSKYKWRYAAGLLFLIIVDIAQVFIPQWIRRAINMVQSDNFLWKDVFRVCLAMTGTMLVICIGRFLWRYFLHGASRGIEAALRETLFSHLITLNSDFYEKNKTGDLMARSTNDIGAVRMAIGWGLVAGIDGTVMAAGILFIIFVQSPWIALPAFIPIPFITLLIVFFGKAVGHRFKRAQEAYSSMSDAVQESFAGIRVIKSFVREENFIKKFTQTNDEYVKANMEVVRVSGVFYPLIIFLSGITILIATLTGGRSVVLGTMKPGDLVSLLSYIQMLVWPMFGAGFTVNMLQRGAVSMARINEILNTKPRITSAYGGETPVQFSAVDEAPVIEIRGLTFMYNETKTALHNVNLTIREGEWLGIFGRTGSGKSTLIKLLPRLIDAPAGTILIKGRDIREWPLTRLRALFGVAPQDSFLFSDTIRNNITYGLSVEREDGVQLTKAVELAALEKDLRGFKDGDRTLIGERGLTLSGGQKQRVTIARAAIAESGILILDDSLSACDAETEKSIIRNLERTRRKKTTIIVSHRISAFRSADHVAVLENGEITEYGKPAELQEQNGYYAKAARLQRMTR